MAKPRKYKKWPLEPFDIGPNSWCYYTGRGMYIVVRDPDNVTLATNISWKKLHAMVDRHKQICRAVR